MRAPSPRLIPSTLYPTPLRAFLFSLFTCRVWDCIHTVRDIRATCNSPRNVHMCSPSYLRCILRAHCHIALLFSSYRVFDARCTDATLRSTAFVATCSAEPDTPVKHCRRPIDNVAWVSTLSVQRVEFAESFFVLTRFDCHCGHQRASIL